MMPFGNLRGHSLGSHKSHELLHTTYTARK